MATAIRFDGGVLNKPRKTANGFLKVDAFLTRTGILNYTLRDGSVLREYRDASEVFHPDALETASLAPVTNEHPQDFVSPDNVRDIACGSAGEAKRDGDRVRAPLLITDPTLIRQMEDGTRRQISMGYTCDVEMTPGEWNGQKYDAVQRNIRMNHIAVVSAGRAGAECAARMDSAAWTPDDGVEPTQDETRKDEKMALIKKRIDGIEFEISEEAAQAVAKLEGRADALAAQVKKLDAEAKSIVASIPGLVTARVALENTAAGIIGEEFKADGKTDNDIKLEVIAHVGVEIPKNRQDDAGFVDGAFEVSVSMAGATSGEETRVAMNDALNAPPNKHQSRIDTAIANAKKADSERWKKPITGAATKSN